MVKSYNTPFDELKAFNPDGYFLSNGPGDPEPLEQVIGTAQKMIASDKCGIKSVLIRFKKDVSEREVLNVIDSLNDDDSFTA